MRLGECLFQDADLDKVEVILSRSNLRGLLAKLDGHPSHSACTLTKEVQQWGLGTTVLVVRAEEDSVHYQEIPRGRMHGDTERAIQWEA